MSADVVEELRDDHVSGISMIRNMCVKLDLSQVRMLHFWLYAMYPSGSLTLFLSCTRRPLVVLLQCFMRDSSKFKRGKGITLMMHSVLACSLV